MKLISPGTEVVIVASDHAQINIGDMGVVDEVMKGGYAVRIKKKFQFVGAAESQAEEERTIFFHRKQVKPKPHGQLPSKSPQNGSTATAHH